MINDEDDEVSHNHALTKSQAARVAVTRIVPFIAGLLLGMAIVATFAALPFYVGLAVWAVGAAIVHTMVFRSVARPRGEKPGLHDFRSYAMDSGIPLIVLGWPVAVPLYLFPEFVEYRLEKLLGIRWEHGKRIFADRTAEPDTH